MCGESFEILNIAVRNDTSTIQLNAIVFVDVRALIKRTVRRCTRKTKQKKKEKKKRTNEGPRKENIKRERKGKVVGATANPLNL